MAEYDAGSIVGSLDLDRDPFTRGLELAREQADEFARNRPTITPDVDTRVAADELHRLQERIDELRNPTITPDVDTRVAAEELRRLQERIDEVTRDRTVDIRVNQQGGAGGPGGAGGGVFGGMGHMAAIVGLIGTALPAIVPLLTAASGASLALAGGLAQGALSLGVFAVLAKSDLTDVNTKLKAVKGNVAALPPEMQQIGRAIQTWNASLATFKAATEASVSGALVQGIKTVRTGMVELIPLMQATGKGVTMMFAVFQNFLQGSAFKNFLNLTKAEVGPALTDIAVILVNIGAAALRMFEIFNPILIKLGQGAEALSGKIDAWSRNGGMDKFARTVYASLRPVEAFLKAFGGALAAIWHALAAGGGSSLSFLTQLLNAIKQLEPALTAIVRLFSPLQLLIEKMLPALVPFVNLLGKLAESAIPLMNSTVSALASGLSGVLRVLSPIVRALTEFFHRIAPANKVLGIIIASLIGAKLAFMGLTAVMDINPVILALTALAAIAVIIVDHWKGFSQFFEHLWKVVYGFFKQYGVYILDAVLPIVGIPLTIIKFWGPISRFFERIWDDVYQFFKQYGVYILDAVLPIVGIPLTIMKFWGPISRFFQRIWNDVSSFFVTAKDRIWPVLEWFVALPLAIYQHWTKITGWLSSIWDEVWSTIKHVWGTIISFFQGIPGKIEAVFHAAGKWLLKAGQDIMSGLLNGIKHIWATILGFYATVYKKILSYFTGALKWLLKAGENIFKGLWSGLHAEWNNILAFFRTIYSVVLNFFSAALSWLVNAGQRIFTGLWNGIKNIWSDILGFLGSIGGWIIGVFAAAGGWLVGAGEAVFHGLAHGMSIIWSSITSFLGGLPGAIMGFFTGAIDWLENVGEQVIQGFWNGLKRIWKDVTGWFSDALGGLESLAKGVLSVFSPSRVFYEIGEYTMLGFHNGLQDTYNTKVAPFMKKSMSDLATGFAPTISSSAALTTTASVTLAGHAKAQADLAARVDKLVDAVRSIPTATGEAVGSTVADRFERATSAQTRQLVTASRKS